MTDMSHLYAIQDRLFHEKARVVEAKTGADREWRLHNVAMIEREEAAEYKFLGIEPVTLDDILSDDELLAELGV